jgi:hypothetical protein
MNNKYTIKQGLFLHRCIINTSPTHTQSIDYYFFNTKNTAPVFFANNSLAVVISCPLMCASHKNAPGAGTAPEKFTKISIIFNCLTNLCCCAVCC